MALKAIVLTVALVAVVVGLTVAYFGIFKDSIWKIDSCLSRMRHYYLALCCYRSVSLTEIIATPNMTPLSHWSIVSVRIAMKRVTKD